MAKKSIIFICFLIFSIVFSETLFSLETNEKKKFPIFAMEISSNTGMMNGSISEFVFSDYCKNTDNKLSRLDWDIITIPYVQLNITIDLFKYIYINASGRLCLPMDSGFMQDYDWMNSVPPMGLESWLKEDPTELTNYSKHNNETNRFFNYSVRLGGNIYICNSFSVTPFVGYQYDFIEMTAHDGYTIYKWDNFEKRTLPLGKCVSYAQELNELIFGLNIDFSGIPRFPIRGAVQVAPSVGRFVALDIHYGRKIAFLDMYSSFFCIEGNLDGAYEFNRHFSLGLSSFIHFTPLTKGKTGGGYLENGKPPSIYNGNPSTLGGASRFMFGIALSCKVSF